MKSLLLISIALVSSAGRSESWSDHKGLVATFRQFQMAEDEKLSRTFTLAGPATVSSTSQGISLSSDSMVFLAVPSPRDKGAYSVSHATAIGHVVIVKTVSGGQGRQSTRIQGAKADYVSHPAESIVNMAGPVHIDSTDELRKQTMAATGQKAMAVLEPTKQTSADSGLRTATMDGQVHLVLTQLNAQTQKTTTVRTTSDHMVLLNQNDGRHITLTGHVHIVGDDGAEASDINRAVLVLGKDGRWKLDTSDKGPPSMMVCNLPLSTPQDQTEDQKATVISGGVRVMLSHFNSGKMDGFGDPAGEQSASVKGSPAQLVAPEKGLTVRGNLLDFAWAQIDPKTMEFRRGRIDGNATIILDSDAAQAAKAEDAKALHQPVPPPLSESSLMEFDSELLTYAGTVAKGTITLPDPWKIHRIAKGLVRRTTIGKESDVPYDQTFDADATKGEVNLLPGPDGTMNQISTASMQGPVHFKITRHEMPPGASLPVTTIYKGVADHLDIDLLTQPGTITALGHVTVDALSNRGALHFSDAKVVFKVDDKLQPLGLHFDGLPGLSQAHVVGGNR